MEDGAPEPRVDHEEPVGDDEAGVLVEDALVPLHAPRQAEVDEEDEAAQADESGQEVQDGEEGGGELLRGTGGEATDGQTDGGGDGGTEGGMEGGREGGREVGREKLRRLMNIAITGPSLEDEGQEGGSKILR